MSFDLIVLGGGHNGLTTAAITAKEGLKVLVLEKRGILGGLAAGEEFSPGYTTQGLLLDTLGLRRLIVTELELERHGLRLRDKAAPIYVPEKHGPGLIVHRDPADMSTGEKGGLSSEDLESYRDYRAFLKRTQGIIRYILDHRPPPIADSGADGMLQLLTTGLRLRALGRGDMMELLRLGPMCAGDWLKDLFKDERLRSALVGPAVEGTFMGPWSSGTVATLLTRECAADTEVLGGPAAVVIALEAAAKEAGVETRLNAPVARIRLKNGKVVGVTLESGEEIDAPVVASSTDPKTTFLKLVGHIHLPVELSEQIRNIRSRGTTAKVNLALKKPLEFPERKGEAFEHIRIGTTLDDIERAFDAVKYGRFSEKPLLDIRLNGKTAEILVHFAPYDLKGGWDKKQREALGDAVIDTLAEHAPKLKDSIVAREVLTPVDIEERYGLTNGHIFHVEPFLDQLYSLRPSVDTSRYATPIEGLFLCGSGSHPGGGITCRPGALGAEAILQHA